MKPRRLSKYKPLLSLFVALGAVASLGCAEMEGPVSAIFSMASEPNIPCAAPQFQGGGLIQVSGVLRHEYRPQELGGLGSLKQKSSPLVQYIISSHSGNQIYCSHTDSEGRFLASLPKSTAPYRITFYSRSLKSDHSFEVLDSPYTKQAYSLSHSFTGSSNQILHLIARERSGLSGAFFILDQLLKAHNFLKTNTASCPQVDPNCSPYSQVGHLETYWSLGHNPGEYISQNSSYGISFYIPGTSKIYILGGTNGNSITQDTDHYDDSVILHEFFHFVQDTHNIQAFPGGSHSGRYMIDPRLASGEAFANFFQAAARNQHNYIDSNSAPYLQGYNHYVDLENYRISFNGHSFQSCRHGSSPECPSNYSGCDIPSTEGEGNFREFAITRYLWDLLDHSPRETSDPVHMSFATLWAHLQTPGKGMTSTQRDLSSIGNFHHIQSSVFQAATEGLSQLRTQNHHHQHNPGSQGHFLEKFALPISPKSSCTQRPFTLNTQAESCNSSAMPKNHSQNHDYFSFQHSGGELNITLNYNSPSNSASKISLGVQIFPLNRSIESEALASSTPQLLHPQDISRTESTSLSARLPSGTYILDVYTHNPNLGLGSAFYSIEIGRQAYCN